MGFNIDIDESWVEWIALVFLILGFLLSLLTNSFFLSVIVISLSGVIIGRSFYVIKNSKGIFPFIIVVLGFLLGYLTGGFVHSHNRTIIVLLFLFFAIVSYKLHDKKILVIFKSKNFLK